jgi:hypothetical protein
MKDRSLEAEDRFNSIAKDLQMVLVIERGGESEREMVWKS